MVNNEDGSCCDFVARGLVYSFLYIVKGYIKEELVISFVSEGGYVSCFVS